MINKLINKYYKEEDIKDININFNMLKDLSTIRDLRKYANALNKRDALK